MRPRDRVVAIAGATALGVAIFAVGGALRGPQAIVAALVGATLAVQLASRSMMVKGSPLIILLGAAGAMTAVQLVPLPTSLVNALEPVGAGLRADGGQIVGFSPASTLTLDVPGTLRGLTFFLTLLGFAIVALRIAATERGRYLILASVAASCGVAAVVSGMHWLLGADRLYGIYKPEQATPAVLGPLLNENQLGGLMALGAVISLGLVMYRRQRSWMRATWFVITGLCGVITMASHSRGATLALLGGVIVVGGLLVGQRVAGRAAPLRRRARFMTRSLPIGVVGACTVIVVVYASAGGISRELSRTSLDEINHPTSKYAMWRSAATLVEESPWVGVGRGAFEPAFTRVHTASAFATFSHLENEYIQAVVDWGFPGASALGIIALWLMVTALRKWRDGPLAAGALAGVAVVALQSNVDFGVEILGLAIPITAVAATLAYVPLREGKTRELVVSRGARGLLVLALIGAMFVLWSNATTSIAEDRAALRERRTLSLDEIRPVIERHPLDYYGYALAAQIAARENAGSSVRLLNHALTLHPTHPGLHLMAAHLLYSTGRVGQSAIEYAAALRGTVDPTHLIAEIVAMFPSELAATAIPLDSHEPGDVVRILESLDRSRVAITWLSRLLDVRRSNLGICEMLYDLSLKRGDLDVVALTTKRCEGFEPSATSRLQLAQTLIKKHQLVEAIDLLKDVDLWPGRINIKVSGWFAMCDAYLELKSWNEAKRCVRRLEGSGYLPQELRGEIRPRLERIDTEIKNALIAEGTGSGAGSGSGSGTGSGSASGSASPPR